MTKKNTTRVTCTNGLRPPCKLSAVESRIWCELIEAQLHLKPAHVPLCLSFVKLYAQMLTDKRPPLSLHRLLSTTAAKLGLAPASASTQQRRGRNPAHSGKTFIEWQRPTKLNGHATESNPADKFFDDVAKKYFD